MVSAIVVAAGCCLALIICVLVKPEVKIKSFTLPVYPFVALVGAVCAIAVTPLTAQESFSEMVGGGAVNPLKILALFISVTFISVYLDEAGFFEFLAAKALSVAGTSQKKLFLMLYLTVSVLTVFTSNDVIILTFTPFIIYFCKSANVKSTPYLVAEFVAANTWSMAFIIGNPTNVYIATSAGYDFMSYFKVMALPTLFAGIAAFAALYALFFKYLKMPLTCGCVQTEIKDKPACAAGVTALAVCTVCLAISGYIGVEMWLVCVICAGVLILASLIISARQRQKHSLLLKAFTRVPYSLIPFVLSMFVVAAALDKTGVTAEIAELLSANTLWLYGAASFISCNLVNNIPMSVLFSSVIAAGETDKAAVFATVIGSNLGALLTPVGALAGIMFSSLTKKRGEKFSNLDFIKYCGTVSLVSLAAALGGLALTLYIWG